MHHVINKHGNKNTANIDAHKQHAGITKKINMHVEHKMESEHETYRFTPRRKSYNF